MKYSSVTALWFAFQLCFVTATDVFIAPNISLENDSSQTTISQYAISNDFDDNETLNFFPGIHALNLTLSINGSQSLVLQGSNAILWCTKSTKLVFQNLLYLEIRNITFMGCVGNVIESVENFVLISSSFQNQEPLFNETVFYMQNILSCAIDNVEFESFIISAAVGVLSIQSSNVTIVDSVFANNSAELGSVLNVFGDSNIQIFNSTFRSNQASMSGGVIYAQSSIVLISASEFYDNYALNLGGVIYSNVSVLTIDDSVCMRNEASHGGVVFADYSTINFLNSTMSLNTASRGSVVYTNFSSLLATDCVFTHNVAGRGGVSYASFSSGSFSNCDCKHNIGGRGGLAYLENSLLTLESSLALNNSGTRGGAVYALTSCSVSLINSSFVGNRASIRGGMLFVVLDSYITITNSTIRENQVDQNSVIYTESNHAMTISDSNFSNNVAGEVGAILSAEKTMVHISNSRFFNNSSPIGVMIISKCSFIADGRCNFDNNSGSFMIINSNATFTGMSSFFNNTHNDKFIDGRSGTAPELGGAITCLLSDVLFLGNTEFVQNHGVHGGAIVAFQCQLYLNDNVNITNNSADVSGGGIYATLSNIAFRGTVNILSNRAQNRGGGIHAISSAVELFSGVVLVSNNSAMFGGGIFIEQNAKLYVIKEQFEYLPPVVDHQRVEMSSNTATYGGAIYAADNSTSGTCASNSEASLTNECFFQTLQAHINIPKNDNINLKNFFFTNNSATESGGTIFGGLLDRCTPGPNAEVVVNDMISSTDALKYLFIVSNIVDSVDIASEPLRICFCREMEGMVLPDCSFVPENITVMKGEKCSMLAVAVDETNRTLPATVRTSLSSKTSGLNEGQLLQKTSYTCSPLEYNIASPNSSVNLLIFAVGPCRDQGRSQRSLQVIFESCQCGIGFQLSLAPSSCECVCDADLSEYISDCHNDTLSRTTNFWIDHTNLTMSQTCIVLYSNCPYDYCIPPTSKRGSLVNLNIPNGADTQCAFNRTGLMCGSCQRGLSLSLGTSRCMQCTDNWIALLVVFALFGILLVSFVLLLDLTVAIGTINGPILYANIVIANRAILLPFSEPAKYFFISWINLDWGFETCFFDGMDAYSKTWLQFVFPLYIFFIVIVIILVSEKSIKFSKLLSGRNPVAALATLILLSYTKLLRTTIAALSFADLECVDGSGSRRVWLFDANIPYFAGKHIPLFIASIIVVIFGLLYTFLLLFGQWLPLLSNWKFLNWINNHKLKTFIEAYHAPYQNRHRYWVGLLLLVRVFLYLVSAYNVTENPYVSLYSVIFAISCLLVLRDLSKTIYKNWAIGALETCFLLNLLVISGASLFVRDIEGNQAALAYTSIYITFLLLLCILVYHLYVQFFAKTKLQNVVLKISNIWNKNVVQKNKESNGIQNPMSTRDISLDVIRANEHPDEVAERYHEPLLDDDTPHSGSYILFNKDTSTAVFSGVTKSVIDGVGEDSVPLSALVM